MNVPRGCKSQEYFALGMLLCLLLFPVKLKLSPYHFKLTREIFEETFSQKVKLLAYCQEIHWCMEAF